MAARHPESPLALTALMCAAQVATLIDAFAFATLIKVFDAEWGLSKVEQGWIAGIYFAGYAIVVPVLLVLTDRIDARRIYLAGALTIAAGAGGFALFADGFWSALLFRTISGIGLAGTYMPGLRVLVDRLGGRSESRAIALYTASWSLGTAISYFASGLLGEAFGWQTAFAVGAVTALAAALLVAALTGPITPHRPDAQTRLLDIRPVLKNRAAVGYILGYATHTWELFAFRAWVVAFLAYTLGQQEMTPPDWARPSTIATLTALFAMFASVLGNEVAGRVGRPRFVATVQIATALFGCTIGFLAGGHYALIATLAVTYAVLIQSDSSSLTAGLVSVAEPGRRGQTLAVYNFIGWSGAFVGPLLVGLVLGMAGPESSLSWGLAFIAIGAVGFPGAWAILALARARPQASPADTVSKTRL